MPGALRSHLRDGVRGWDFQRQITWIFGSPRSGSTWLWKMLADHPQTVPINEPLIGLYLSPFLSDLPGVDPAGLTSETFTMRLQRRDHPHHLFAEAYRDVWAPALAQLVETRFKEQARRVRCDVPLRRKAVIVKEPNGSQSADLIMEVQPRARLLFLLRDGRDVVDSELAANEAGSWVSSEFPGFRGIAREDRLAFLRQSAHKWLWRTEVVQRAYAQHPGPKLLLTYEDLRERPAERMGAVLDLLQLPAEREWVREAVESNAFERIPEQDRGHGRFARSARPGSWAENLSPEESGVLHSILGSKLRELGYAA